MMYAPNNRLLSVLDRSFLQMPVLDFRYPGYLFPKNYLTNYLQTKVNKAKFCFTFFSILEVVWASIHRQNKKEEILRWGLIAFD